MRLVGCPGPEKPGNMMVEPSGMSATASSKDRQTLFRIALSRDTLRR